MTANKFLFLPANASFVIAGTGREAKNFLLSNVILAIIFLESILPDCQPLR